MSDPVPDGVPHPPTPEELEALREVNPTLAALASAQTPTEPRTAALLPEERATLMGLVAARDAVNREVEGYLTNIIAARLGVHRNRILGADVAKGTITLASDAPKE